jgi:ankyrin repeat protein
MQKKILSLLLCASSALLSSQLSTDNPVPVAIENKPAKSISKTRQAELDDELMTMIIEETCMVEGVKELVEAGADLTSVDYEWGGTPLMWAAYHNNRDLVNYLVQGSDVNAHNDAGETALMWLAYLKHEGKDGFTAAQIMETIIKAGADITMRDELGNTALMEAAYSDNVALVQFLLHTKISQINDADNDGNTALHHAASENALSCVKHLISGKAKISLKNNKNETPLHIAAMNGYVEAVDLLVKALIKNNNVDALNSLDVNDFTPLHWAAIKGHAIVVSLLANAKAALNTLDKDGHTPLEDAASKGQVAVVDVLIKKGTGVNTHGAQGVTALHRAVKNGHIKTTQLLLDHGAQIDITDSEGRTPLHYAVRAGRTKLIDPLVAAGADPFKNDKYGQSPADNASDEMKTFISQAIQKYKNIRASEIGNQVRGENSSTKVGEHTQINQPSSTLRSTARYLTYFIAGAGLLGTGALVVHYGCQYKNRKASRHTL